MNLLSAQQVAKILNVDQSTVRLNASRGRYPFKHIRVGALWKFNEDEVMEFRYGKNWREIIGKQGDDSENGSNN